MADLLVNERVATSYAADNVEIFIAPGLPGSLVSLKPRYENFIGGKWVAPVKGEYMNDVSPVNGEVFCQVAVRRKRTWSWRSTRPTPSPSVGRDVARRPREGPEQDRRRARGQPHHAGGRRELRERKAGARDVGGGPAARDRSLPVLRRCHALARGSHDRDRPRHGGVPLPRAARCRGTDHPLQLPALDGGVEDRPGTGRGQLHGRQAGVTDAVVDTQVRRIARRNRARQGVINIVTGPGAEIGKALATSPRIAKIGFTGETTTGRLIMQYAAENIIPSTVELGGKSPNIFFADVMDADDEFLDKAIEGLVLYAFNKGEVCTCPSRALIQESIYDRFMERCLARIGRIVQGNPLDTATMIGPQVSTQQLEKIESYVEIGKQEGAQVLIGGQRHRGRWGPGGWVLLRAHGAEGSQQDAGLPRGDLRTGLGGDDVQGRSPGARDRERLALRVGRGRVDA